MSSSDILTDPALQGRKVSGSQSTATEGNEVGGRHVLQAKPISNIKDHRQSILQPLEVHCDKGQGDGSGYPLPISGTSIRAENRFDGKSDTLPCDHTAPKLARTPNTPFSEHAITSGKRTR